MSTEPLEEFTEQVKQVLAHLYDFPYLQTHPLAGQLAELEPGDEQSRGQALRRLHLAAIERLNPGATVPFGAPHARLYNLLQMHYVEALTIGECAAELNISVRQAYRDLRRAEASVAAVLWEKFTANQSPPRAVQLSSIQKEVERIEPAPTSLDLCLLVRRVHSTIERLAQQRAITLSVQLPSDPVVVIADIAVSQQVLTMLWSHAVQHAEQSVDVVLAQQADKVTLGFCYQTGATRADGDDLTALIQQLAQKMGWRLALVCAEGGDVTIHVELRVDSPTVLVIDDNQGLVELLERYLTDRTWRVISASNGKDGLELAQSFQPDVIILDVMMPGIDGWEVLQLLRSRSETAAIPVIICSVFNDPELALSLGADIVMPKPVSRTQVLDALHQLRVVP